MDDHVGSSDNFKELLQLVSSGYDWWHIYDGENESICDQGQNGLGK